MPDLSPDSTGCRPETTTTCSCSGPIDSTASRRGPKVLRYYLPSLVRRSQASNRVDDDIQPARCLVGVDRLTGCETPHHQLRLCLYDRQVVEHLVLVTGFLVVIIQRGSRWPHTDLLFGVCVRRADLRHAAYEASGCTIQSHRTIT